MTEIYRVRSAVSITVSDDIICPLGGIGRHAEFRPLYRKMCEFESRGGYFRIGILKPGVTGIKEPRSYQCLIAVCAVLRKRQQLTTNYKVTVMVAKPSPYLCSMVGLVRP